jgi:flagellar protein FliS
MSAARKYMETQVLTAPREQLLLMLLDGAIRFGRQARGLTESGKHGEAHNLYVRAQAIALELAGAADAKMDADVRANLAGLYMFAHRRLVEANVARSPESADEALAILEKLRGMWAEAVAREKAGVADGKIPPESQVALQG